ncbi:MAG: hypothetical protein EU544_03740 [Promethearchaeota archaeon]|nr:MAG: hypothetical protein EU544_03740 [Candidatus Lokiarchaeota archaeon]
MSEGEDLYQKYAMYHTISDFEDLSISEVITLQFLVRYSNPVVRHTLYNEVKQFIEFQEKSPFLETEFYKNLNKKKKFTTGKFYHSLSKLKDKGLLEFDGEVGKVSVKPTPQTKFVSKLLMKFIINNDIMNSQEYREEFSEEFLKRIGDMNLDKTLSIWLSEYIPYSIAEQIANYSEESYILSKNEIIEANSKDDFKYTEIINGKIREHADFYDGAMIPVYKRNPKFHDMSNTDILKEISRVTKPNGMIALIAVANIKETNNIFIDQILKVYKTALINRMATEGELKKEFTKAGIQVVEIFEQQGLLIGIGKNVKN